MARWKFNPLRLGVWGMLAIVLVGAGTLWTGAGKSGRSEFSRRRGAEPARKHQGAG